MMTATMTYRQHFTAILGLGLPLAGSQLAQISLSLVDALMLGWYDPSVLAAEVLANALFIVLFLAGSGFAAGVSALIAAAEGRGDHTQARRVTRMCFWLSGLAGLAALPLLLGARGIFLALGQQAELAELAGQYLDIVAWSIFPALGVMVLKGLLGAVERTRIVLVSTLVAVAVNAFGNWILIFGNWGAPELGIRGAAWSSLIMQVATFAFLVVYVMRVLPQLNLFVRLWRPDWEAFHQVFRLGWPIGLTLVAEVGLFAASSVMMGWVGEVALIAHGIALQITSATFMIHLGFSQAATIRAGRAHGRGTMGDLKRGARSSIVLSTGVVVASAVLFIGWPDLLVGVFLDPGEPMRDEILAYGRVFLLATALFGMADGMQVLALALLRGLQDTQRPMLHAAFSYWVVGAPMAYVLCFVAGLGGVGIWIGLAIGLSLAAVLMMRRLWRTVIPAVTRETQLRRAGAPA